MTSGHAGEWIASRIFDLELVPSAANPAYDGRQLRGVKIGVTTSVRQATWAAAEIYPKGVSKALVLSPEQHQVLALLMNSGLPVRSLTPT